MRNEKDHPADVILKIDREYVESCLYHLGLSEDKLARVVEEVRFLLHKNNVASWIGGLISLAADELVPDSREHNGAGTPQENTGGCSCPNRHP